MVVARKRSIITDVNAALPLHICKGSACLPVPKSAGEEGRQPEKCGVCTSPSDKQSLSAVARRYKTACWKDSSMWRLEY